MENKPYAIMIAGITTPDMADYVKGYLLRMMEHSRHETGCILYNIHQSKDKPNEFMMYSVWKDQADFEKHNQTPEMQEFKHELAKAMFEIQSPKTIWELLE